MGYQISRRVGGKTEKLLALRTAGPCIQRALIAQRTYSEVHLRIELPDKTPCQLAALDL